MTALTHDTPLFPSYNSSLRNLLLHQVFHFISTLFYDFEVVSSVYFVTVCLRRGRGRQTGPVSEIERRCFAMRVPRRLSAQFTFPPSFQEHFFPRVPFSVPKKARSVPPYLSIPSSLPASHNTLSLPLATDCSAAVVVSLQKVM